MEAATAKETTCGAISTVYGVTCVKPSSHASSHNPQEKQHVASNGVKWPSLAELDPNEGFNVFVTHRM